MASNADAKLAPNYNVKGEKMDKLSYQFVHELANIKNPEIFMGVARILKVHLSAGKDPKPFEDVLAEVIESFEIAPPKRRKELYSILKKANRNAD